MTLAYVKWRDAVAEEADDPRAPVAQLVTLEEVGFLLDENEDAVLIGMEYHEDDEVRPGRWRLNIPRAAILELKTRDVAKAFGRGATRMI